MTIGKALEELQKRFKDSTIEGRVLKYCGGFELDFTFWSNIADEDEDQLLMVRIIKSHFYDLGKSFSITYRNEEGEQGQAVLLTVDSVIYEGGSEFQCFVEAMINIVEPGSAQVR